MHVLVSLHDCVCRRFPSVLRPARDPRASSYHALRFQQAAAGLFQTDMVSGDSSITLGVDVAWNFLKPRRAD